MTDAESPQKPYQSLAPDDPKPPYKTWRGTLVIAGGVVVFCAVLAFILYRWADLQSFSPEMRFEGYHRFSGTLLPPGPLFASSMIKWNIRTQKGRGSGWRSARREWGNN